MTAFDLHHSTLAIRNLLRNKRRSVSTLMTIIFGALAVLLFGGYAQSIRLGLETNIVRNGGHLQVQHPDFLLFGSGNLLDYTVTDYEEIVNILRTDPLLASRVNVISSSLSFNGIAGNFSAGLSKTVLAMGTVVSDQNVMRQWNEYKLPIPIREQKLVGNSQDTVVIGQGVARILQLCNSLDVHECPRPSAHKHDSALPITPTNIQGLAAETMPKYAVSSGKRLEVLAVTPRGAPNVAELEVVNIERQGVRSFDDVYVGMHLKAAQRLVFGRAAPRVTAILIQLIHGKDIDLVRNRVQELLNLKFESQHLIVHDFRTLNPNFSQTVAMFDAIFGFISVLIAIIVIFTVSNTMSMAVVERTVEIGTLRAIGLREAGLRRVFVFEGLILGIVGAIAGLALALTLAQGLEALGVTWTPPGYVDPMPLNIAIWGQWKIIIFTTMSLVGIAATSAWWPAKRAASLQIVDALRYV